MTARQSQGSPRERDNGFTLIELLVVVVIIGVLIAIAIPLYLNYRKGAEDKSAASDLRSAIAVVEQCYADNSSAYAGSIDATTSTATNVKFLYGATDCTTTANLSSATAMRYRTVTGGYQLETRHGTNPNYFCYLSTTASSVAKQTTVCW